ncbi:branched-chain amino acid transaminase [Candidatus Deianiraea vastatrix]|uniref:Probable branched-chain-amino-acid aminotransferase n=1 Tax=Candidatus Deianiraea vastatrix TaxID=2163644 RepID=A0A5B8XEB6_9RICK|nr:branched-chain amino acid transaminase [Candidatus Deianiraea vastatrix]QED23689.1 Branched-chain-amino-acid aminotransferase [Candidatus Deianiraea vastatrix]
MFDTNSIIWFNGKLVRASEVSLSVFTHAVHYGTAIFEGCRAYNGKIFKCDEHSARLINSGVLIDVPVGYSKEELSKAAYSVLDANGLRDGYVRPFAWRGDENLGIKSYANSVNVAILAWSWPSYFGPEKLSEGLKLSATKYVRPDPRSTQTQAKASGLYFVGSIMQNKCKNEGYDDVLMLDWRGYIAECASCNVFFIKGDEIHTPIADCFLNGITRQTVMDIARGLGYRVIERHIMPQELGSFSEAFTTGTAVEIMPIGEIFDSFNYSKRDVTMRIRDEYLKMVNR